MKIILVWCLATSMVVAAGLPASALTGKVIDWDGKPIPNAVVDVVQEACNSESVADQNGGFVNVYGMLTRVSDRDGKPLAGAKVTELAFFNSFKGQVRTDKSGHFNVTLPKAMRVWLGTSVVDSTGKPAPGAILSSEVMEGRKWSVTMDEKGRRPFPRRKGTPESAPMEYALTATADGCTYASARYSVGSPGPVFKLYPAHKYVGHVLDEDGKPLAGATVKVSAIDAHSKGVDTNVWNLAREPLSTVTTGADGSFPVLHVPELVGKCYASVRLAVSLTGRALINKDLNADDILKGAVITLPRECKLEGTAYLPGKSQPAPKGIKLRALIPNGRQPDMRSVLVGDGGKFEFAQLPPGKISVMAEPQTPEYDGSNEVTISKPLPWTIPAMELTVSPDHLNAVEVVAQTGSLIRGRIVDKVSGKPVGQAALRVSSLSTSGGRPDFIAADTQGNFAIRVPAGATTITFDGYHIDDGWTMGESEPVNLEAMDGKDLSDIVVSASPRSDSVWSLSSKEMPPGFTLTPGSYDLTWNPEFPIVNNLESDEAVKPKSLIKKLPKLVSNAPAYLAFRVDGADNSGLLLAVVDEAGGRGIGDMIAYVDVNRNGDLTDDAPMRWTPKPLGYDSGTPWITIPSHQGPAGPHQTNHPIQVMLTLNSRDFETLQLQRKGAWTTMVDSSAGKVQFALVDSNGNGMYNDRRRYVPDVECGQRTVPGDHGFVDDTSFGSAVSREDGPHSIRLYNQSAVAGKTYVIDASPTGDHVSIAPYSGPTGGLSVHLQAIPGFMPLLLSFSAKGDSGDYNWKIGDTPLALPPGRYMVECKVSLKAGKGVSGNLTCYAQPDMVQAGRTVQASVGGKLILTVMPGKEPITLKPGQTIDVAGEARLGKAYTEIGFENTVATVKLIDYKGKEVYRVYGESGYPHAEMTLPKLKPGIYRLQLNVGPLVSTREVTIAG